MSTLPPPSINLPGRPVEYDLIPGSCAVCRSALTVRVAELFGLEGDLLERHLWWVAGSALWATTRPGSRAGDRHTCPGRPS